MRGAKGKDFPRRVQILYKFRMNRSLSPTQKKRLEVNLFELIFRVLLNFASFANAGQPNGQTTLVVLRSVCAYGAEYSVEAAERHLGVRQKCYLHVAIIRRERYERGRRVATFGKIDLILETRLRKRVNRYGPRVTVDRIGATSVQRAVVENKEVSWHDHGHQRRAQSPFRLSFFHHGCEAACEIMAPRAYFCPSVGYGRACAVGFGLHGCVH